jgi:CRISPR-associated protein Cmr1
VAAREKLTAHFRIVTPMFLGGAGHEATRIRGASLKGALAFWWRAFYFAGFMENADGDISHALNNTHKREKALTEMRRRERELFGSSDEGQGRFLLRVSHGELRAENKGSVLRNGGQVVGVGARYLGYGVMGAFGQNTGKLERSCIAADQCFTVDILFHPKATEDDKRQIATALKLLGLLGGLGARVRRGWGSLALERLEGAGWDWQGPQSREEYEAKLQELFEGHPGKALSGTDWPLTAFAKESGVWLGAAGQGFALNSLNDLGDGFLRFRGWRNGDQNFPQDHDWYRKDSGKPDTVPERTAFGLPHNYAKRLGVNGPDKLERRGSPLMFHVHKAGNGNTFPVAALMPVQFMPQGKVAIVQGEGRNAKKTSVEYDFHNDGLPVIKAFLDGTKPDGSKPASSYFRGKRVFP